MFPKIDAETARKNRRALAITMIAMAVFGMTVMGIHALVGPTAWLFPVAFVAGAVYVWGVVAFIIRTES